MIRKILGLCSRDCGHPAMYQMLDEALSDFNSRRLPWESLIHQAEAHGVAPLLYKHFTHLGFTLPHGHQRTLRSLYQRCRLSNQIRNSAVTQIVDLYRQQKIDNLLVKGIALANHVYSAPDLRPMRDIDVLVSGDDLEKAKTLLLDLGYRQKQDHKVPDDYYHLPPLVKTFDGLPVTIELHHDLLPLDPWYPRWPLEKSFATARSFTVNGLAAATLRLEDNLWYLYLHGFGSPLTYEEFRYIHVADLVSLTEKYYHQIDWNDVAGQCENLSAILSRFHFLTPWTDEIISALQLDVQRPPARPGIGYRGWPLRKIKDSSFKDLLPLLYETLYPSQWWTQIRYGHLSGMDLLKVRVFEHPRAVWRWVKAPVQQRLRKSGSS